MKRIVLLFFIFLSGPVLSQWIIEVNDAVDERIFMPQELFYYIDSTNTLSFERISSGEFSNKFSQHSSYQNKDFRTNTSYWIKFPIRHKVETKKSCLLEFYDPSIDRIAAYIPQVAGACRSLS